MGRDRGEFVNRFSLDKNKQGKRITEEFKLVKPTLNIVELEIKIFSR